VRLSVLTIDIFDGMRQPAAMPRKLRIQYPGALYHVMNRGDRRENIFRDDADREGFLSALAEACGKTEWQVHAYCLEGRGLAAAAQRGSGEGNGGASVAAGNGDEFKVHSTTIAHGQLDVCL
jgi:hypothetical protein